MSQVVSVVESDRALAQEDFAEQVADALHRDALAEVEDPFAFDRFGDERRPPQGSGDARGTLLASMIASLGISATINGIRVPME